MASKQKTFPKKRHGIVVFLDESSKGNLALVLDTVEKTEKGNPAEWVVQRNFTRHEYPAEMMERFQLTQRELADIGEALMIWLLSKDGHLKD